MASATAPVHPQPDPYQRRRDAGAASRTLTRAKLLDAADALFRERGYAATTVSAIAAEAGVSVQTLYLAWGSKRALLRAATDAAADAAADPTAGERAAAAAATAQVQLPVQGDEWRESLRAELDAAVGDDPRAAAYLAAVTRTFVRVAERTAPYWRMHRQAAAADAELAADWDALMADRRRAMEVVAQGVVQSGEGLRPGLGVAEVTDTLWTLASPEVHELLTAGAGYSTAAFSAWLERTLVATLCADDGA